MGVGEDKESRFLHGPPQKKKTTLQQTRSQMCDSLPLLLSFSSSPRNKKRTKDWNGTWMDVPFPDQEDVSLRFHLSIVTFQSLLRTE